MHHLPGRRARVAVLDCCCHHRKKRASTWWRGRGPSGRAYVIRSPPSYPHPNLAPCRKQNPGRTPTGMLLLQVLVIVQCHRWLTILRHLNPRTISTVADPASPVDPERFYALCSLFRLLCTLLSWRSRQLNLTSAQLLPPASTSRLRTPLERNRVATDRLHSLRIRAQHNPRKSQVLCRADWCPWAALVLIRTHLTSICVRLSGRPIPSIPSQGP